MPTWYIVTMMVAVFGIYGFIWSHKRLRGWATAGVIACTSLLIAVMVWGWATYDRIHVREPASGDCIRIDRDASGDWQCTATREEE